MDIDEDFTTSKKKRNNKEIEESASQNIETSFDRIKKNMWISEDDSFNYNSESETTQSKKDKKKFSIADHLKIGSLFGKKRKAEVVDDDTVESDKKRRKADKKAAEKLKNEESKQMKKANEESKEKKTSQKKENHEEGIDVTETTKGSELKHPADVRYERFLETLSQPKKSKNDRKTPTKPIYSTEAVEASGKDLRITIDSSSPSASDKEKPASVSDKTSNAAVTDGRRVILITDSSEESDAKQRASTLTSYTDQPSHSGQSKTQTASKSTRSQNSEKFILGSKSICFICCCF